MHICINIYVYKYLYIYIYIYTWHLMGYCPPQQKLTSYDWNPPVRKLSNLPTLKMF